MDESAFELLNTPGSPQDHSIFRNGGVQQVELWIYFPDARSAEYRVAGVPAAARVVRAVVQASGQQPAMCTVASGEWQVSRNCIAESLRLAQCAPFQKLPHGRLSADVLIIDGLRLLALIAKDPQSQAWATPGQLAKFEWTEAAAAVDPLERRAILRDASRSFLRATGKKEDGIVSRYLNRPVSRSISALLLKHPGVRPLHATAGTALLALLMLAAMIMGGSDGAIAGALLFHAASVFDGVDGEIARATYRTSAKGARLDSLIDAATNLAFLGGLSFNLAMRGQGEAALAGLAGILILALGLWQIGSRSQSLGQPINFEAVKVHLRRGRPNSLLTNLIIWLTMRDFIAAACATAVVFGHAAETLYIFLFCASGWLISISLILARTRSKLQPFRQNSPEA